MTIHRLEVTQFRCIKSARLDLDQRRNLIVGANASGKTSLLEALFVLGTGHSFRTSQSDRLIQIGTDSFMTVGHLRDGQVESVIGLRGGRDGKEGRINGQSARSLAELAAQFPVQSIDPEVHQLLEEGPNRRRQYLDWGVFHVEHPFRESWRRYQRALRQRNAALRSGQPERLVRVWDEDLVQHGQVVTQCRTQYLSALLPFVRNLGLQLLELDIELEYQSGWKRSLALDQALSESWSRDQATGSTHAGPHRADVLVKAGGIPAKDRISRGQQKLLACTLVLAQQLHRAAIGAPPACLLLDDPAAELDVDNLGKLLNAMSTLPAQLVVTGLNRDVLQFFPDARLFHVEHGNVQPMA